MPDWRVLQIAYREREVRAWASLAGFVGNAAAGKVLKRLAAQRRPAVRCALLGNCGSFGMPSLHAQSMAFAWALHLCQARGRMQPRQVRPRTPVRPALQALPFEAHMVRLPAWRGAALAHRLRSWPSTCAFSICRPPGVPQGVLAQQECKQHAFKRRLSGMP